MRIKIAVFTLGLMTVIGWHWFSDASSQCTELINDAAWFPTGDYLVLATCSGVSILNPDLEEIVRLNHGIGSTSVSVRQIETDFQIAVAYGKSVDIHSFDGESHTTTLVKTLLFDNWAGLVRFSPDGEFLAVIEDIISGSITSYLATFSIWDSHDFTHVSTYPQYISFPVPDGLNTDYIVSSDYVVWGELNNQPALAILGIIGIVDQTTVTEGSPWGMILFSTAAEMVQTADMARIDLYEVVWNPPIGVFTVAREHGVVNVRFTPEATDENLSGRIDIRAIDWSPDGRYLATNINLIDYEAGVELEIPEPNFPDFIKWRPHTSQIYWIYSQGIITSFDANEIEGVQLEATLDIEVDQ